MRRLTTNSLRTFSLLSLLGVTACGEVASDPFSSVDAGSPPSFDGSTLQPVDSGQTGADSGSAAADGTGIPCAIQTILRDKCTNCHAASPQYGSPMSLASYAALQAPSKNDATKTTAAVSQTRINATGSTHMPPSNQPQLDATQLTALNAWLAAGAPKSSETCGSGGTNPPPDAGTSTDTTGLECYKLTAHAPGSKTERYKVGTANDKYLNFSFTAPWQGTAYGVVLRPIIDNAKVLHHWLLFRTAVAVDGQIADSSGAHPTGELVFGWAPGGTALDFRKEGDVGFEFPAGTNFEVEFHYNSTDGAAEDASGVEVCVQTKKPANLAGVSWLGSDLFNGTSSTTICRPHLAAPTPIHIVSLSPHMHLKGKHMKGTIIRANGTREIMHDSPFDFYNQSWYPAKFTLNQGDTIETVCTWSAPVSFGTATSAEMCYLFTVAYPKGALADLKATGTAAHGGGACLGEGPF